MMEVSVPMKALATILKILRVLVGLTLVLALMFTVAFSGAFYNRVKVQLNRDHFVKTTFVVTGYSKDSHLESESEWLDGTINGKLERFVPDRPKGGWNKSGVSMAKQFPAGTEVAVLFAPNESSNLIQGESPRVRQFSTDFWQREDRFFKGLMFYMVIPLPALYLLYRFIRHQHRKALAAGETAPKQS